MLKLIISLAKATVPNKTFIFFKSMIHKLAKWIHKKTINKHFKKLEKRVLQIRNKKKINVLFINSTLAKWKAESLYNLMKSHTRFSPTICVCFDYSEHNLLIRQNKRKQLVNHFKTLGYHVVEAANKKEAIKKHCPDIVFPCEPYESIYDILNTNTLKTLYCYVPYGFRNTTESYSYNNVLQNKYWYNFVENEYIADIAKQVMDNKGANVKSVGYLPFDYWLNDSERKSVWKKQYKTKKKIIWAPHWSIDPQTTPFVVSTFLEYAQFMIQLAKKYSDQVQFAFKPHPLLHSALCTHSEWGENRTNEYYNFWKIEQNTQLETNNYEDLFYQSDAMIHDCGSFIVEYLYLDKPCMYLSRKNASVIFNKITNDAIHCYRIGTSFNDIETFINDIINSQNDVHKENRNDFKNKYLIPQKNTSAAENIVKLLLGE